VAESISVDFDIVSQHASRVERVAADIGVAQEAIGSVNLGGGAFGLMCSFMVPPVQIVSALASSAVGAAHDMVERSAREIRAAGKDLEAFEEYATSEFAALENEVPSGGTGL
jgi:hypothetical protein